MHRDGVVRLRPYRPVGSEHRHLLIVPARMDLHQHRPRDAPCWSGADDRPRGRHLRRRAARAGRARRGRPSSVGAVVARPRADHHPGPGRQGAPVAGGRRACGGPARSGCEPWRDGVLVHYYLRADPGWSGPSRRPRPGSTASAVAGRSSGSGRCTRSRTTWSADANPGSRPGRRRRTSSTRPRRPMSRQMSEPMTQTTPPSTCPSCGATVRQDVPWCLQCYASLRPEPRPRRRPLHPRPGSRPRRPPSRGTASSLPTSPRRARAPTAQDALAAAAEADRVADELLARLAYEDRQVNWVARARAVPRRSDRRDRRRDRRGRPRRARWC